MVLAEFVHKLRQTNFVNTQTCVITTLLFFLRFSEQHYTRFPNLRLLKNAEVSTMRLKFLLLKEVNELFKKNLCKIDLRRIYDESSLANLVHRTNDLIFTQVKHDFMQQIFDATAENNPAPKLIIDQFRLSDASSVTLCVCLIYTRP